MTANNLTRAEAAERARLLRVERCRVELDLTEADSATFGSRSTVHFSCTEPGAATFIEIAADSLDSATLNGTALDVAAAFDGKRLTLTGLAADNELAVAARARYSRTGEGLHRFVDPVDGQVYLYTQFESYDAHRMYACFDQPDLKSSFELSVTAPPEWTCVSNAPVAERDGGRWRFEPTARISTYITALVAGPYHEVRSEHDGIDLGLFCRSSLAGDLDPEELFELTRQGFDFYHRNFDYRYPFGKYDQLFVPEFNAGAMENAGCITFLEDYVFRSKVTDSRRERRAETILHEMAHMWFGDLVTMRWWDDLWLNESFATYVSVLAQVSATRFVNGWTTFCNSEKTWAYRQDQLPSTHPVVADATDIEAVRTNFDGITYAKGASVLKQLVSWVGQEEFMAGLRVYFRRHEYANTSLADLLAVLADASGRDLSAWSHDWLETTGVNTLRAGFEVDSGLFSSFQVYQEAPEDHPTLRPHRIAIGLYTLRDGALVRTDRVELDITGAVTEVPKLVGLAQPDLILLNDDDLTYAKIRLDPRSQETLVDHIGDFSQGLPRALCWNAAWDMTRDAEMPARAWVSLVLSGLAAETDVGLVQSLLAKTEVAIWSYADPAQVAGLRERFAAAVTDWLLASPAGSDHQLALATALARAAVSADQVGLVAALLDGSRELDGLVVDTELRWTLLTELVIRGERGDAAIDAELERDPTAAGEKRAATARSCRPSAEAKAAAWSAVLDDDALSNHLMGATMAGFWVPQQLELTRPYVSRFFERIGDVWRDRSQEMAQAITGMLYPSGVIDPVVVAETERYLGEQSPQPGLARLLAEGRDGIQRALRNQAYDRTAGAGPS